MFERGAVDDRPVHRDAAFRDPFLRIAAGAEACPRPWPWRCARRPAMRRRTPPRGARDAAGRAGRRVPGRSAACLRSAACPQSVACLQSAVCLQSPCRGRDGRPPRACGTAAARHRARSGAAAGRRPRAAGGPPWGGRASSRRPGRSSVRGRACHPPRACGMRACRRRGRSGAADALRLPAGGKAAFRRSRCP